MTADFGNFKRKVRPDVEYVFYNIEGEPAIYVKYTGTSNKKYTNERLRMMSDIQRRKAKVITADMLEQIREFDYKLFPLHVVTRFGDKVVDAKGAHVVSTPDNFNAFLRAIGDSEFDALRSFCDDETNFQDVADMQATAGNSQPA